MMKILGILCKGLVGRVFNAISFSYYMKYTIWYYRKCGIKIQPPVTYIHPSVYFDSHNYSLISIGKNVTISRNVTFLVHDYSIANALEYMGLIVKEGVPHFEKSIEVADNSFIGVNAILLPGTKVGKNCIIGSGAV